MSTYLKIITRMGLIAILVSILGLPVLSALAADQPSRGPALVAPGAVEDSLLACLARIPKDASAGQRMMAEQSCKRDEGTREVAQAVPGR